MFNVGDKVKIRGDLKIGTNYKGCHLTSDMSNYIGKIATIVKDTTSSYDASPNYHLDVDGSEWYWTEEMLIPIEEVKSKYYHEDVVKEMLESKKTPSLDDVVHEMEIKQKESESVRLAKAVCEYEEIVHNLEQDLHKMLDKKNAYKAMYQEMLDMYNNLVDEYNELVDEYNSLI